MANRSFEFKIGADTSDFIKEMNKADKAVNSFDKQAQKLEKGLEIKFDESRFTQSQKLMQQALELTEQRAEACRQELKYLEETGQVDTKAYQDIQLQLANAENKAVLLNKQLKELNNIKFTTLGNNIKGVGQSITGLANSMKTISIASGAVVAGLAKVAKETIATGDEISTLASKYNLTAVEIQRLQYIAMQSDVADTSLYKGLQKVNSALADLSRGEVNNATKALTELGLTANSSFEEIIYALSDLTEATDKVYYANQIFGDKLGADIIPLLNQGSKAVQGYVKEFEEVGYLSEDSVANLSRVDNVLNKLKETFRQLALSLGETLIPVVEKFATYLQTNVAPKVQKIIDKFNSMSDSSKEMAIKIAILIPVITGLTAGIGKLLVGLGNIMISLPKLGSALSALEAHPIIAIIGIIAILLTVLYTRNEEFRESINRLLGVLSKSALPIMEQLAGLITDIFNLLGPIIEIVGNDLAKVIQFICVILEPLVELLSWIMEAINTINDGILTLFGKGWLWGTDEESSAPPTYSTPTYNPEDFQTYSIPSTSGTSNQTYNEDNSTVINNITIEANEYTSAEEVARILSLKLQSRR